MTEYKGKTKTGFQYAAAPARAGRVAAIGRMAAADHDARGVFFKLPSEIIDRLDVSSFGGSRAAIVAGLLMFALDRIEKERLDFQVFPAGKKAEK